MRGCRPVFAMVLFFVLGVALAAEPEVGRVARIQGSATADRGAEKRDLALDAQVHEGDLVRTAAGARLQIRFSDGMEITLGENSQLRIDRFLYDPKAREGAAGLNLGGSFRVLTGAVGKLAPDKVRLSTPVADLGLRGTEFWGGPIEGLLDVIVLSGRVQVTTPGGRVILEAGKGTVIRARDRPPAPPYIWSEAKIKRAVASVAFD